MICKWLFAAVQRRNYRNATEHCFCSRSADVKARAHIACICMHNERMLLSQRFRNTLDSSVHFTTERCTSCSGMLSYCGRATSARKHTGTSRQTLVRATCNLIYSNVRYSPSVGPPTQEQQQQQSTTTMLIMIIMMTSLTVVVDTLSVRAVRGTTHADWSRYAKHCFAYALIVYWRMAQSWSRCNSIPGSSIKMYWDTSIFWWQRGGNVQKVE